MFSHLSGQKGLFWVLLFSFCSLFPFAKAELSQSEAESVYKTWVLSLTRGDFDMWKDSTALFRQRMVRNLAISEKKKFPDSLFREQEMRPPSVSDLQFVGIITKGPTAAATYYGKIDFGVGGKPTNNALVLLFAQEKSGWKFDTSRFFNLSQLPDVKARLAKGDKSLLSEQDGFQPTGIIPPLPPLCPAPHYITKVFVDCPGRKVQVKINNVSLHQFEDERKADIVSGGLQGGANSISYTIEPSPRGKPAHLVIGLYIMPEVAGNLPGKAFFYGVNADKIPQNGQAMVLVNKELLSTMQGKKKTASKTPAKP